MTDMTVTAQRHTPSVSEIQAALRAARAGHFAVTDPTSEAEPPSGVSVTASPGPKRHSRRPPEPTPEPTTGTVTLLAVHGGAGARSLALVLPGSRYAGRQWPAEPAGRVVLVCRSNHRGYTAAQQFARAHRDDEGLQADHELAGVVVVADCPGRTPGALRRLERLMSGAVPLLGRVPWMPDWRLGPPDPAAPAPEWATKLAAAVGASR